ncbi:hypothetical protein RHMOL_Rhmol02G0219100 [Rhododendron molle]|uniref:Uncharacterized protein n=1 Tax=Rhododendron molle TaxID=49168 RepID=A0ACC0PT65_RHOML|nr:hypothetical protein RHMOL_Rhmol02G0219100 [Rhododendron molle]
MRGPAADPTGYGTGFQIFGNTLTGNTLCKITSSRNCIFVREYKDVFSLGDNLIWTPNQAGRNESPESKASKMGKLKRVAMEDDFDLDLSRYVKEDLPPHLDSTSEPPPLFDGTTRYTLPSFLFDFDMYKFI